MTSKELIRKTVNFGGAPRIGMDFSSGRTDIHYMSSTEKSRPDAAYAAWGYYPELLAQVPGFAGEVSRSRGSILGRLGGRTKGECIRAALEDGWEGYDAFYETYMLPGTDPANFTYSTDRTDMFEIAGVTALQAPIRDARKIGNMLMDTILEPEALSRFIDACADVACAQAEAACASGADAVMMWDDWGMQNSLYISLPSFRSLWKPAYARVGQKAHSLGMCFFLHSCGYVEDAVPDFIECGVDAFQFDQPSIYHQDKLRDMLGGHAALYAPVDIQQILPTGDRDLIEREARRMLALYFHDGGGLIAKDYPSLDDIGVRPEWSAWAEEIFVSEGAM